MPVPVPVPVQPDRHSALYLLYQQGTKKAAYLDVAPWGVAEKSDRSYKLVGPRYLETRDPGLTAKRARPNRLRGHL